MVYPLAFTFYRTWKEYWVVSFDSHMCPVCDPQGRMAPFTRCIEDTSVFIFLTSVSFQQLPVSHVAQKKVSIPPVSKIDPGLITPVLSNERLVKATWLRLGQWEVRFAEHLQEGDLSSLDSVGLEISVSGRDSCCDLATDPVINPSTWQRGAVEGTWILGDTVEPESAECPRPLDLQLCEGMILRVAWSFLLLAVWSTLNAMWVSWDSEVKRIA